jgi:hypothetical protein
MRLIQQTGSQSSSISHISFAGVLKQLDTTPYLIQSIFYTLGLLVIFVVFQCSVYLQFGKTVQLSFDDLEFMELVRRTLGASPALLVIVYFTHKNTKRAWMQNIYFVVSLVAGFQHLRMILRPTDYQTLMLTPGLGTVRLLD